LSADTARAILCAVPPLRFAEESRAVLERGVHLGIPVTLIAAGQAAAIRQRFEIHLPQR